MIHFRSALRPVLGASCLFAAAPAVAWQDGTSQLSAAGSSPLEEIVVTAQKREERIQTVPIAITAFSAQTARALGVTGVTSLSGVVPGLDYGRTANGSVPYLRGVGTPAISQGNERPVALYIDDVYIAASTSGLFAFNNIDRIEVLKGPQGTLFGRNATGGVIRIITRTPSRTPGVDADIGYGNYDAVTGTIYGTTGITDMLAADLAVYYTHQGDGWGTNLATGHDVYTNREIALRSKWLLDLDATRVTFSADYDRAKDSSGIALRALPGGRLRVGAGPVFGYPGYFNINSDIDSIGDNKQWGLSLKIDHDLDWARLTSITAYRDADARGIFDTDASPNPALDTLTVQKARTWTQELQLLSAPQSRIRWIAGLFYFDDSARYAPLKIGPAPTQLINDRQASRSYSIFGETTLPLFEATGLTLGGRYTIDRRRVTGRIFATNIPPRSITFRKFTYRATIDHTFGENVLAYVTASRGFKSGLFNLVSPTTAPVKPETLDDIEGGIKTGFFDQRLRVNLAAFHYSYENIQLNRQVVGGTVLLNAARAKVKGLELDAAAALTRQFSVQAGLSLLDSRYGDFPNAPCAFPNPAGGNTQPAAGCLATGNRLPKTPKATLNIGGQYAKATAIGGIALAANYIYNNGFFWAPDNRIAQPSFGLLNASLTWTSPGRRFDARLWGKNLTGKRYNAYVVSVTAGDGASPGAPRTYGLTVGAHWR